MRRHTFAGTPQAAELTPEFADRFAVLGPADYCIERLRAIAGLGLSKLVTIGPSAGSDIGEALAALARFAGEVLPALHAS